MERYVSDEYCLSPAVSLGHPSLTLSSQHFYIGTNILWNYKEFLTAFEVLEDDIAVHTVSCLLFRLLHDWTF